MLSYREILDKNRRKTKLVILSFLLLYIFIGFLYDIIFYIFYNKTYTKDLNFSDLFLSYIKLQQIPYFTLTLFLIGFISTFIAFQFYEKISLWKTNYKEITNKPSLNIKERQLFNIVEEMKIAANLKHLPKIFLIDAVYMNAFSSGLTEKKSMIVITSELLNNLSRDELQAVIAHEITHIQNLDIKLLLFINILSNLMLLAIDLLFNFSRFTGIKQTDGNSSLIANIFIIISRIMLPLITTLLSFHLSRSRDYIADANAVKLTQNNLALISALKKIKNNYDSNNSSDFGREFRTKSYIYQPTTKFANQPTIEQRLTALCK